MSAAMSYFHIFRKQAAAIGAVAEIPPYLLLLCRTSYYLLTKHIPLGYHWHFLQGTSPMSLVDTCNIHFHLLLGMFR